MEETKKKKTKPVRLVPLTTSKEPLPQRTVPELFSSSGSLQVKASTPTGVEVETSKKLPLAWTSLLKEKPLANQEATVTAASSIEKSNTAQTSGLPTHIPSTSSDIGSTSEWRPGKNTNEIRGGSSERGC